MLAVAPNAKPNGLPNAGLPAQAHAQVPVAPQQSAPEVLHVDAAAYLADCQARKRSPRTLGTYREAIVRLLRETGHPVTHQAIEAYAARTDHLQARRQALDALRRYTRWIQRAGRSIPSWHIPTLQEPARPPRVWPRGAWERFQDVAEAAPQPSGMILSLLVGGAFRAEELLTLPRKALERAAEVEAVEFVGKGRKQATVPLPRWVIESVAEVLADTGARWQTVGDLLARRRSVGYQKTVLRSLVAWACRQAGMSESGTPHEVRHNIAVEILRNGGSLEHVRRTLRHSGYNHLWRYAELAGDELLAVRTRK